jgi:hypothetical protein
MVLQSKGKAADISAAISDDIIQDFPTRVLFGLKTPRSPTLNPDVKLEGEAGSNESSIMVFHVIIYFCRS